MKNTIKEDLIDIVGLLHDGPTPWERVPEQERNFDAGISMTRPPLRKKGKVKLDGTWYNIVEESSEARTNSMHKNRKW